MMNEMIFDMQLVQLAEIYDEYASQIYGRRVTTLPRHNISKGKQYKAYRKFLELLYRIDMTDPDCMRLFIRVQYECMWKSHAWKNKVIPVNLMCSKFSINRFIEFVEAKTEKFGKLRVDRYFDNFVNAPLIKDINCLSLTEDTKLMYTYIRKLRDSNKKVSPDDVIKAAVFIEAGKIISSSKYSVCPAYLYLNSNIDADRDIVKKFFGGKIKKVEDTVKKRGRTYIHILQSKKSKIVDAILVSLSKEDKEFYGTYI